MKTLAKTITCTIAALGLAGAAAGPVLAGEAAPHRMQLEVKTDDLNLATPAGQRTLDQRIAKAVRSVCRVTNVSTGSRIMARETQACIAKARADAKQKMAALISKEQRGG